MLMISLLKNQKTNKHGVEYINIYMKLAPNASDIQNAKDAITKWELLKERS